MTRNSKPLAAMNGGMPHGVGTPLIKVQLHRWPPPHLSLGQARKLHLQLVDELRRALDPVCVKGPSCGYQARHEQATTRDTLESLEDKEKTCWLDSTTIRGCVVDGTETVCRVDHYICDDGSWYDEVIPLAAEAGGSGGENGLQAEMRGQSKAPRAGAGGRAAARQKARSA